MRRLWTGLPALCVSFCLLLAACGPASPAESTPPGAAPSPSAAPTPEATPTPEPTPDLASQVFSELEGVTLVFSSGAGGWFTQLDMGPDGSFTGSFRDSEMGEFGPDYPNGTVFFCDFSGTFAVTEQCSDWEYILEISSLELGQAEDESYIQDGVRYKAAGPYGLNGAEELRLYCPGAPTSELPAAFVEWISMPRAWSQEDIPAELPFWGLYNVTQEQGFSGE